VLKPFGGHAVLARWYGILAAGLAIASRILLARAFTSLVRVTIVSGLALFARLPGSSGCDHRWRWKNIIMVPHGQQMYSQQPLPKIGEI